MYESWDSLKKFILNVNEAWSYKSRSKQMLGWKIFDKVNEISHYHFLLQYSQK